MTPSCNLLREVGPQSPLIVREHRPLSSGLKVLAARIHLDFYICHCIFQSSFSRAELQHTVLLGVMNGQTKRCLMMFVFAVSSSDLAVHLRPRWISGTSQQRRQHAKGEGGRSRKSVDRIQSRHPAGGVRAEEERRRTGRQPGSVCCRERGTCDVLH